MFRCDHTLISNVKTANSIIEKEAILIKLKY